MDEPVIKKRVVTIEFTLGDSVGLLAHSMLVQGVDGEEPKLSWVVNTNQFATQNGLSLPDGVPAEYTAYSDEELQELASKLLSAVVSTREQIEEHRKVETQTFASALPKNEVSELDAVEPPAN